MPASDGSNRGTEGTEGGRMTVERGRRTHGLRGADEGRLLKIGILTAIMSDLFACIHLGPHEMRSCNLQSKILLREGCFGFG